MGISWMDERDEGASAEALLAFNQWLLDPVGLAAWHEQAKRDHAARRDRKVRRKADRRAARHYADE